MAILIAIVSPALPAGAVDFPPGSGFTVEQRREIEAVVASADGRLDVRILTRLPDDSYGSASLAASRIQQASEHFQTQVIVWGGPEALPAFGVSGRGEAYCAMPAVRESEFDEHQQFVELVRLVADGTACQAMDEALAERFKDRGHHRTGGTVEQPAAARTWLIRGLVIAAGVLLLAALVYFRGRAIRDAVRRKRRGRALTGFASDAAKRSKAEQAHAELLAFGEELDHAEMRAGDRMDRWQQALDAYDEASRLHDRGADDRRVIELCSVGRRHLARATSR